MQKLRNRPVLAKWINQPKNYQKALKLCNCKALIVNVISDNMVILADDDQRISFLLLDQGNLYLMTGFKAVARDRSEGGDYYQPGEKTGYYRLATYPVKGGRDGIGEKRTLQGSTGTENRDIFIDV